ncbi:MAG: PEGA domain-containing protein [Polyangiaceae bacterium]|nr:PEGA domain-containing protein [Polyangiaceae bacterium]
MISASSYSSWQHRLRSVRRYFVLFAAVTTWAALAPAQEEEADAQTRTAARELARQGAEAYDNGDDQTALDRLDRAYALVPAPSISVMQARVLVRLGRWVEALDRYEKTRVTVLGPTAPEAFRQAVADATTEGEALRLRIPRLAVHVTTPNGPPPGLGVTLDGKPVPPELLDVERPLDPGSHDVAASAPGYEPVVRRVEVDEADNVALEIVLSLHLEPATPPSPEPQKTQAPNPRHAPRSDRMSTREVTGWAALGLGAAGVATGAVTGLIALRKKSRLDSICGPDGSGCPPGSKDDIASYRLNVRLSYVSFAVGIASAGAGGYLLLAGNHDSSHVAAAFGADGVTLSGRF